VRCVLPPGARVSEQSLADYLQMGRAPVRTALAQLSRDGLVIAVPRVGYEITQVTLRFAQELFEARECIELYSVRQAVGKLSSEHLNELTQLAEVDCTIGDPVSVEEYLRANRELHVKLVRYGSNGYLAELLTDTLERMARIMYLGHMRSRNLGIENDGSHPLLLACLQNGDAVGAEAVLRAHLERARERTFAALMTSPALLDINLGGADGENPVSR